MGHDVLTIEEVCQFFRVDTQAVQREIDAGRLPTITIGGEWRVLRSDLLNFLETAKRVSTANPNDSFDTGAPQFELELKPAPPFDYKWPWNREHYDEAYSGTVHVGNEASTAQIGFTTREAAGKLRRRAIVFIDRYPMVEFVAADDFEESKNMVSLVKRENGKQVRPGEPTPVQYHGLRVEPYRKHVTGPYASTNLAVVCRSNDHTAMVEHALIRRRAREAARTA